MGSYVHTTATAGLLLLTATLPTVRTFPLVPSYVARFFCAACEGTFTRPGVLYMCLASHTQAPSVTHVAPSQSQAAQLPTRSHWAPAGGAHAAKEPWCPRPAGWSPRATQLQRRRGSNPQHSATRTIAARLLVEFRESEPLGSHCHAKFLTGVARSAI